MKRFVVLAVVLISLAMPALVRADCNDFTCFNEGTTDTTCDITFCGGGSDCGTYNALSCRVYCDKGGLGGGCWCSPQGECMIV
jgi:hypothetical protein